MPLPSGGPDFCRLLARGTAEGTPIVSRNAGDNYILVRIRKCDYRDLAVGGGKSSAKRRDRRYPRRIRVGDEWYLVHSIEEERRVLQAYLRSLETRKEAVPSAEKPKLRKRIKYTVSRLKTLAQAQSEEHHKKVQANNDFIATYMRTTWM